jgi:alanine dehydrogenase
MSQPQTPFTKAQLLPQEETLEVLKRKGELFIGIPKENHFQEKRVCLTPDAVSALSANGHRILIESKAGLGANYTDNDYSEAGAEISKDRTKVYGCPIVLKVEPPSLDEIEILSPQALIISALQLKTQSKAYFEALAKKRVTALAFEFIKDEDGAYPAVRALSEIAGTASILIASELMSNVNGGNGIMMGNISGVPPTEVVIIGAGTVGEFAARRALGLGANVKVFDNSITKLRRLQASLGRSVYTSTMQPKNLLKSLQRCDVAIGAVRGSNRSPVVVTTTMVEHMKPGAVIIDVSIDMGGCFETSEVTTHDHPTFEKYGVIHYGVPNIPARYARSSSVSISNISPHILSKLQKVGVLNMRFDSTKV